MIKWVKTSLQNLTIQLANAAVSTASKVLLVQHVGQNGEALPSGASGTDPVFVTGSASAGGGAGLYSSLQGDCSVAYTAATQVTITGLPAILSTENFVQVDQWDSSGSKTSWKPSNNAFDFNSATGVLTVTGATFAATDIGYDVLFWYTPKAYNQPGNFNNVYDVNPIWARQTSTTVADASGETDGTNPYFIALDGYRHFSIQIEDTPGAAGTNTYTLEATNQSDGTDAASCTYQDVTSSLTGSSSYTSDAFWIIDTPQTFKYLKVNVVRSADGGNNDGAWKIYVRQSW